jgi:hypothetical protein
MTISGASVALADKREAHGSDPAQTLDHAWQGMRPATCMPDHCFCERIRHGAIRQPANTWSNLGFVLVGVATLVIGAWDLSNAEQGEYANPMRTRWVYPAIYGVTTILIGVGSALYHSSLAFVGQSVDVMSMYLLTSFMLLYNASRAYRVGSGRFLASYVALNLVSGAIGVRWPETRRYVFLLLVVGVLASEVAIRKRIRPRASIPFLYAALASLVMACAAWILDVTGTICRTDSWLQGHAMWHVLMASLIGFIYLYYRSEAIGGAE